VPLATRIESLRDQLTEQNVVRGAIVFAAVTGLASLVIYGVSGYSRGMLLLWLLGVCTLAYLFRVRSAPLPRIAGRDFLWAGGLMVLFAPLYLGRIYEWPVQVISDEGTIMGVSHDYATRANVDPFSVSDYWLRPSLLFMGWGRMGNLIGGIDLYHMRLLHAFVGLLVVAASYGLFRLMLPRGWAAFAACLVGLNHALLMISRLAMRENTAVLAEVVALTLLIWGLRNEHDFVTYLGGLAAGFGFYVYHPGRATYPLWLVMLATLALLYRDRYSLRRLARAGAISAASFVLLAVPVSLSESKAPQPVGEAAPRAQLFIFPEGRELQKNWVNAPTVWDGYKKNVSFGLTTFNNRVVDHGWIYVNPGHGFVDPLTGVLLWLGAAVLVVLYVRRRKQEEPEPLLMLVGFVFLWLAFAFVVNEAPKYPRLLITLPFVAFLVTVAVRWLGGRLQAGIARVWPSRAGRGRVALAAGVLAAIGIANIAFAWDFVQEGRKHGDPIGNTGRYIAANRDQAVYLVADQGTYRYIRWGQPDWWRIWTSNFRGNSGVKDVVPPAQVGSFRPDTPFAFLMSRLLLERNEGFLRDLWSAGRVRNITPDGKLVAFEVK
jgi:hypothetical protein